MITDMNRRRLLRGMMGGAAISVGLPFLDCFLNTNGTALADGTPLPVCFGTWFQGLGFNPGFWEPKTVGAKYEFGEQLQTLTPFKDRINIFSGMTALLDGKPLSPHASGPQVILSGGIPRGQATPGPSIDQLIADVIGLKSRFRSLEVSCYGSPDSRSLRGTGAPNPSEVSPVALYTRLFGPEFKDPNAAEFVPDPAVMVRRSALSAVTEQRQSIAKRLDPSDRIRLDEYFTSLRELENRLDLELQKPAPLQACTVPGKPEEATPGTIVDDALVNHGLFAGLLAHALACGQTRVINVVFGGSGSQLRRSNNPDTFHLVTHEETMDQKLGYQPNVTWFQSQVVLAFKQMLTTMDSIREGDGTLLDRVLLFYSTDHGFAKLHTLENIPMMTAGRAGGRMKTGFHIEAKGDPVTRVGLTIQQAMGVPIGAWGTESNQTSKTITELVA